MKNKILLRVLSGICLVLVLVLVVGACAKKPPEPTPTFKIGAVVPLTGPGASYGEAFIRCAIMDVEEVNAKGGINILGKKTLLDYIALDDKYSADQGKVAAEKLIFGEGVKIMGVAGWVSVSVIMPLAEANEVILLTAAASPVTLPKYMFRETPDWAVGVGAGLVKYMVENRPELRKFVVVGWDDDTGYRQCADAASVLMAAGLQVLSAELIEKGTKDFAPLATKINALNPDAVWFYLPSEISGACIHQARELGAKWVPLHVTIEVDLLTTAATEEDIEGMLAPGIVVSGPDASEEALAWAAKYKERFGVLQELSAYYVMGMRAVIKALETTKSLDFDDLVYALENVGDIPVVNGYARWGGAERAGIPHQALYPVSILEVRSGKAVKLCDVAPAELPAGVKTLEELGLR